MSNSSHSKYPGSVVALLSLSLSPFAYAGAIPLDAVLQSSTNLQFRNLPAQIVGSIPRETCSGNNCPDFWIERVEFLSLVDRTVQIRAYTKRVRSQLGAAPMKITAEVNGNWILLDESNARVDGSATGFANTRSFNLPVDASQIGVILSPGLDVQESNYDNNAKTFSVRIADLSFLPSSIEHKAGAVAGQPNRNAVITLINNGPQALVAGACTLNLELRPIGGSVSVAIQAMPRRTQFQKKVPYLAGQSTEIQSRIQCNPNQGDIITGNNSQSFRFP